MKKLNLIRMESFITKIMIQPQTILERIDIRTDVAKEIINISDKFHSLPTVFALVEKDTFNKKNIYFLKIEGKGTKRDFIRFYRTDHSIRKVEESYSRYTKIYNDNLPTLNQTNEFQKPKVFKHWLFIENERPVYDLEYHLAEQALGLSKEEAVSFVDNLRLEIEAKYIKEDEEYFEEEAID